MTEGRADVPGAHAPPLLRCFPGLRGKLPWLSFGAFPTAIEPLPRLSEHVGAGPIFVKREDCSAPRYGGNKIRKLELLLADALTRGCRSIVTMGGVGSNQVVATALYGKLVGLDVIAVLADQPVHDYVRANLRYVLELGCRVILAPHAVAIPGIMAWLASAERRRTGAAPYLLGPGGSSALGTVGFVSAGLEIAEQVAAGAMPEPDRLVVAVGSTGTMAGLLLGLRLGGLRTRVVGVGVVHRTVANRWVVASRARATRALLQRCDPTFPRPEITAADTHVVGGFEGPGYACPTPEALDAVRLAQELEGLVLEPTYTGKTLAALLAGLGQRDRLTGTTLFVNTFNSRPLPNVDLAAVTAKPLPPGLRRYL